jgi:hypothetical protein
MSLIEIQQVQSMGRSRTNNAAGRGSILVIGVCLALWGMPACKEMPFESPALTGGSAGQGAGGTDLGSGEPNGSEFEIPPDDDWDPYTEWISSCQRVPEALVLEPPCSESDVVLWSTCEWTPYYKLWLDRLDELSVPSAPDLRVIILPQTSEDMGGEGGQTSEPQVLSVRFQRSDDVVETSLGFQLLQHGVHGYVILEPYDTHYAYFTAFSDSESAESYHVAQIAIVHGAEILLQWRLITHPHTQCLTK